jgi:uroporphyrinogen-III synthase
MLEGRRILVTRAAEQAGEFVDLLHQRGARVIECPTIELVPPERWDEIDAAAAALGSFDWLILTSVNGVRFFFGRLQALGLTVPRIPQGCKVCVVGPKTAEALVAFGIRPDLIPQQFTGEGVVAAFEGIDLHGKTLLFPKADGARDLIPLELARRGAVVTAPVVYRNVIPVTLPDAAQAALEKRQLDAVVFSSPSTVRNFATLLGGEERLKELMKGIAVASIGPVTSQACRELGLAVAVEPEQATLDALVDELELFLLLQAENGLLAQVT